jgi:hypothetical protein
MLVDLFQGHMLRVRGRFDRSNTPSLRQRQRQQQQPTAAEPLSAEAVAVLKEAEQAGEEHEKEKRPENPPAPFLTGYDRKKLQLLALEAERDAMRATRLKKLKEEEEEERRREVQRQPEQELPAEWSTKEGVEARPFNSKAVDPSLMTQKQIWAMRRQPGAPRGSTLHRYVGKPGAVFG